jgi:hypothetical protein
LFSVGRWRKHVAADRFDLVEDPRSARNGGSYLQAETAGQRACERQSTLQKRARAFALERHQFTPAIVHALLGDLLLRDAEAREILLRDVHAVLAPIDFHVLPEIDLLQRRADGVRQLGSGR